MGTLLVFTIFFIIGYYFFLMFSHPEKKKHKVPCIKFGNLEFLPNFRIHIRNHTYHFHHWILLTLFVSGFFMFFDGMLPLKGVAFGGILQGLSYKDRFRLWHKRQRFLK